MLVRRYYIVVLVLFNLLVAQVKKYPEVLGGVEIGNGKVRMNIPVINKVVEFDTDDIKTLKETLITK